MNNTKRSLNFLAGLLILVCVAAGCKSHPLTQYVSPRVEGRVLDVRSHEPIAGVQVRRLSADESMHISSPPKGGEMMKMQPIVRTGPDGTYALQSLKDVAVLRRIDWYSVTLSFQHSDYVPSTTTYTVANATNSAAGEPLVLAPDVLLIPVNR